MQELAKRPIAARVARERLLRHQELAQYDPRDRGDEQPARQQASIVEGRSRALHHLFTQVRVGKCRECAGPEQREIPSGAGVLVDLGDAAVAQATLHERRRSQADTAWRRRNRHRREQQIFWHREREPVVVIDHVDGARTGFVAQLADPVHRVDVHIGEVPKIPVHWYAPALRVAICFRIEPAEVAYADETIERKPARVLSELLFTLAPQLERRPVGAVRFERRVELGDAGLERRAARQRPGGDLRSHVGLGHATRQSGG